MDILNILITTILAVLGWILGHYFNTKRDQSLKRREIIISHLINSYRVLTNDIVQRNESAERNKIIENILSDLQLFGTIQQIDLSKKLVDDIVNGGEFLLDPLTTNLRNDLRKQLGLKEVEGNIKWLRFKY